MKLNILLSAVALVLLMSVSSGCTKEDKTQKILASQGFTNIQTTGYRFFGCSEDDFFHTGFTAVSTGGQQVSGVVCSGWFKGSTVRFD